MTRKSKREIEQKVEELDGVRVDGYPKLDNLAMILGFDWKQVDGEKNLYERQDTGEVYHAPPEVIQAISDALTDGD
jgi:hypothetical protein